MKPWLLLLICLSPWASLIAQTQNSDDCRARVRKGDDWFMINPTGEVTLELKGQKPVPGARNLIYTNNGGETHWRTSLGFNAAFHGGKSGIKRRDGSVILKNTYDYIGPLDDENHPLRI